MTEICTQQVSSMQDESTTDCLKCLATTHCQECYTMSLQLYNVDVMTVLTVV